MRVQLLHVPDCPSVAPLLARLASAVGERADVRITSEKVADEARAAVLGMAGSPTLLVDGRDPFPQPGSVPGLSCRLYRDERGRLARVPSLTQLRHALAEEPDNA